jgi:Flp pilus assembly protein TadG
MMSFSSIARPPSRASLRRFLRDEDGVAMIEFAVVLPMMLLVFALIIEGSRMMLSYESAINGVRDATRYLARTAPANLCISGASVTSYATYLQTLVRQGVSANSVFPSNVTIGTVTPSYRCVAGTYRGGGAVPVAQVSAVVTVTFPFSGLFTLVGGALPTLTTVVTDQARVFGS